MEELLSLLNEHSTWGILILLCLIFIINVISFFVQNSKSSVINKHLFNLIDEQAVIKQMNIEKNPEIQIHSYGHIYILYIRIYK